MKKSLFEVLDTFDEAYSGLRETARLVVAVAATTRLVRDLPIAVILVGPPSSGKTTCLMPMTKGGDGSALKDQVFRIDDFNAPSLVSHAANRNAKDLANQDLLPQFENKLVVVKEMAPLFSGHEDELIRKFAVLTSVLDGMGHISGSGSHGRRGYARPIVFSLIGAVTKHVISGHVWKSLGGIGPRFCFWEVFGRQIDPLKWEGSSPEQQQLQRQAEDMLSDFVDELMKLHEPGSVPRQSFELSLENKKILNTIAVALTLFRAIGSSEGDEESDGSDVQYEPESPERVFKYLEQIVTGSALADGRTVISHVDLRLALQLAIGSAPPLRRGVIRALTESEAKMTVREVSIVVDKDDATVRKRLDLLVKLGVAEKVNYDGTAEYDLREAFKILRLLQPVRAPKAWDDNAVAPQQTLF